MASKKGFSGGVERKSWVMWLVVGVLIALAVWLTIKNNQTNNQKQMGLGSKESVQVTDRKYEGELVKLVAASKTGRMSLEQAINQRRSRREFLDKELTAKQISQLLWSTQGVTADWGGRSVPSAKEVYPLEVYLVVNKVEGLKSGIYHYIPGTLKDGHSLGLVKSGDFRSEVEAAVVQSPAKGAPVVLVLAANFGKMAATFAAPSANNNVYLEAGHAGQNLYLQVESLGLGMVTIGGFDHAKLRTVVSIPASESLIYAIPIGVPKQ